MDIFNKVGLYIPNIVLVTNISGYNTCIANMNATRTCEQLPASSVQ